jgi:hypothetical protein
MIFDEKKKILNVKNRYSGYDTFKEILLGKSLSTKLKKN